MQLGWTFLSGQMKKKKNQTRLQNQVAYDVIYLNMHDIVNTLYK